MRDAYDRFFKSLNVTPEAFFQFGISEIIHIPCEIARTEWEQLKQRVTNGEPVTIRTFGRNGSGTSLFLDLYKDVLAHAAILPDSTNNSEPTRLIRDLTGFSKQKRKGCELIRNYQVSHVFGRTKNPYAFTAPWNIVYLPKIVDPFTGHESQGQRSRGFQRVFQRHVYTLFKDLIDDFNEIVADREITSKIESHVCGLTLDGKQRDRFVAGVREAFEPIILD